MEHLNRHPPLVRANVYICKPPPLFWILHCITPCPLTFHTPVFINSYTRTFDTPRFWFSHGTAYIYTLHFAFLRLFYFCFCIFAGLVDDVLLLFIASGGMDYRFYILG